MSKDLSVNITVHCRDCGEPLTYQTVYADGEYNSVHMDVPACTLCMKGEFDRGYTMGNAEGEARGYAEGYDAGCNVNGEFDRGYAVGNEDGEARGYAEGYDDGYDEGCEASIVFVDDELKEDY